MLERISEEAKTAQRNKLQPILGVVTEIGTGEFDGMVRVRREPHEPTDAGRGFYYVVGSVPPLGAQVWCHANHATGFVYGDFVTSAYQTIADSATPRPQQDTLNFGLGISAVDNAADARTDITLSPGELMASPSADGFMAATDKSKVNSVETGATADQTATEIFTAVSALDGAGTGLDSDTVDGSHAAAFAPSSHVGSGGSAHALATTSVAGFLSAADKTTLDGHIGAGGTAHAAATISQAGFLSGSDKSKLNGLQTKAMAAFHVYSTSAQSIPDSTYTKLGLNVESYDTEAWYNTAIQLYNPQRAGLYIFGASVQIPAIPASGGELWIKLYKNNAPSRLIASVPGNSTVTFDVFVAGTAMCDANGSTDTFDVRVWHNFGGSRNVTAHQDFTTFWGYYIGTL